MSFTGREEHGITLNEAAELTKDYRNQMAANQILGGFFGKDAFRAILDQSNCVGIRYYYGLNSAGQQVLVLVGVTEDENDLYNGVLAELSVPCPNHCSSNNPLNSD